jgi:hypothetical protein
MYWAEWGKLRDVLRDRGLTFAQIEEHRHAVTRRALGVAKSSKLFTNRDLDAVLARIKAEREPGNLNAQMEIQESPEKRRAKVLEGCFHACSEIYNNGGNNSFRDLGTCERYIGGIARNVIKKSVADCTAEELAKVRGILDVQVDRAKRQNAERHAPSPTNQNPF